MYVALRTLGIFISWIRVFKFIYLLTQTDDIFVSKQNRSPYQFRRIKKTQKLLIVISNETLSMAPRFTYPKAGATNHPNFPVKLLFLNIDRQ